MACGIESIDVKLQRATEHFCAIQNGIAAYIATKPYEIVRDSDGKEKEFRVLTNPPLPLSVLVGELVYQLRSTIDHLAFSLVQKADWTRLPRDWEGKCAFPLHLRLPAQPTSRCEFEREMPGISDKVFAFIEAIQPYYAPNRNRARHLLWLSQLSNFDKHRYLNLIYNKGRYIQAIRTADGDTTFSMQTVYNGAEFKRETPDSTSAMDVKAGFFPFVAFHEAVLLDGGRLPAQEVLQACFDSVENFIVPTMCEFLNQQRLTAEIAKI